MLEAIPLQSISTSMAHVSRQLVKLRGKGNNCGVAKDGHNQERERERGFCGPEELFSSFNNYHLVCQSDPAQLNCQVKCTTTATSE